MVGTRTKQQYRNPGVLVAAAASRLILALADRLDTADRAHLVLTGGTVGTDMLRAVAVHPAVSAVNWPRVHFWWGDERFLPAGHRDRNDTQARAALLAHLDLDPRTVHPMPASDGEDGADLDAAATRYAAELAQFASAASPAAPQFDVLLLGLGPDGHVASLFPGHPQVLVDDVTVLGESDSPKPPPQRLSLALPTINDAHEIWLVVAGADKADAVARAIAGGDPSQTPAAAVKARGVTRFLLDDAAATAL